MGQEAALMAVVACLELTKSNGLMVDWNIALMATMEHALGGVISDGNGNLYARPPA